MSFASTVTRRAPSLAAVAFAMLLVSTLAVAGPASAYSGDDLDRDVISEQSDRRDSTRQVESDAPVTATAAGEIYGRLLLQTSTTPIVVVDGLVQFYSSASAWELVDEVATDSDGTFSITGLPAGVYKVAFVSYQAGSEWPSRIWVGGASNWFDSGVVIFTDGDPYEFGDVVIPRRDISLLRLAGNDRFETAAAVSDFLWAPGIGGTVFVVNGLNFPDALSAGAATTNGVLAMVTANSIPAATAADLVRVQPDRIVVVGGTGVVSPAVFAELANYVDDPSDVVRIEGENRYETSREVITSASGFNSNVQELLIATGRNFPDALSAVPAAIVRDAAVLLVDGAASSLDAETRALVETLGVPVTIIGGTGVVSAGIQSELTGITQTIRVFGENRYDTSVAVAEEFFATADYAFQANGLGFADALAAGPAAGSLQAPVYLVQQNCVPDNVFSDVLYVLANLVISVGGTGVISEDAATGIPCSTL